MGHTRQQYEDRIRQRLGDFGIRQTVVEASIPLVLEDAFARLSSDRPRRSAQTFPGDGVAFEFDLTADALADSFVVAWSRVTSVEYPAGSRIPEYLDAFSQWTEADGTVRLLEATPSVGQTVVIRYVSPWPYPTDDPADDPLPDLWFQAVCSLAAGRAARAQAVEFARKQSNSIAGTTYQQDPSPLFEAARELEAVYSSTITGALPGDSDAGSVVAMAVQTMDVFGDTVLFHRSHRRSG